MTTTFVPVVWLASALVLLASWAAPGSSAGQVNGQRGQLLLNGELTQVVQTKAHFASVTVAVPGRVIKTSADVPAVIDTRDDDYTITFGNHEVRVEKERLLLDVKEAANIPASATNVTVVVSDATLTVTADSSNIVTTNITR